LTIFSSEFILEGGNLTLRDEFHKVFDIRVCARCCSADDQYELISKTKAKSEYLLTDAELDKLAYLEKKNPNPKSKGWGTMKLVLKSKVEEISRKKFRDDEQLEQEKIRREVAQLNRKVNNNKKKRESETRNLALEEKSSKLAKSLDQKFSNHVHTFDESKKSYRASDCTFQNTCTSCGFIKSYQEL
jgi:DNA repair protein